MKQKVEMSIPTSLKLLFELIETGAVSYIYKAARRKFQIFHFSFQTAYSETVSKYS